MEIKEQNRCKGVLESLDELKFDTWEEGKNKHKQICLALRRLLIDRELQRCWNILVGKEEKVQFEVECYYLEPFIQDSLDIVEYLQDACNIQLFGLLLDSLGKSPLILGSKCEENIDPPVKHGSVSLNRFTQWPRLFITSNHKLYRYNIIEVVNAVSTCCNIAHNKQVSNVRVHILVGLIRCHLENLETSANGVSMMEALIKLDGIEIFIPIAIILDAAMIIARSPSIHTIKNKILEI